MEAGLKKLEAQEQRYSAELDKALSEYADLKAQASDFDPVELYKARQAIRPAQEKAVEAQLEETSQQKPSLRMLLSAKPVSYTHLDVYKRQGTAPRPWLLWSASKRNSSRKGSRSGTSCKAGSRRGETVGAETKPHRP